MKCKIRIRTEYYQGSDLWRLKDCTLNSLFTYVQACLFYGCPSWSEATAAPDVWLPAVCESMCPVISLSNSTFTDSSKKRGTARIVGWKDFGIANSLTCEISMGGGGEIDGMSPWAGLQLNPNHYRSLLSQPSLSQAISISTFFSTSLSFANIAKMTRVITAGASAAA